MSLQTPLEYTRILSCKTALSRSRIESVAAVSLQPGESRLSLERFALTTNNITYAAFGESMRYWNFFPTGQSQWGHMPVWGIARVIESTLHGVEPGQRHFGYYPIAEHFVCKPHRISERGFADSTDYRQSLPSAYNYYSMCSASGKKSEQSENYEILIRPLFLTSYMLADYLRDNRYFDAEQLLVSSASSKTAYGSAWCLSDQSPQIVALTSTRNIEFVELTGCYSSVKVYDEMETIDNRVPTLYVDFQGTQAMRGRVHRHFASNLKHDCFVGSAASLQAPKHDPSNSVAPQFFFAAEHINRRNKQTGATKVNRQMNDAQHRFISEIASGADPWLRIVAHTGIKSSEEIIACLCRNQVSANEGHIVVVS